MFAIWRHRPSGARYLVVVRDGQVQVAAGPLVPHEDPRRVLEQRSNQHHSVRALLHMRRVPAEYECEYFPGPDGRARRVAGPLPENP